MWRIGFVVSIAAAVVGTAVWVLATAPAALSRPASALTSVTPGWECVPTTAGDPVVSGGTGAAPSCTGGTTAVLAPTYVSSGVGGKPTAEFSSVNVQIVSGSGSTSGAVNGEGNLIVGYGENTFGRRQSGSNDLIVGSANGWTGYGEIVGGFNDLASGNYSVAAGQGNTASGGYSAAIGGKANVASGNISSVTGGEFNLASDPFSAVAGGCDGVAGSASALTGACGISGYESVSGGVLNEAEGLFSSVSGGQQNQANGVATSVSGGDHNSAGSGFGSGNFASVSGGGSNVANGDESAIAGGQYNETLDDDSFIVGGCDNLAGIGTALTGNCVNADSGLLDGHDTILGGLTNVTTALGSSISGGENNQATGATSSILGGNGVTVSGTDKTAPQGIATSVTGSVGFTLGAGVCGGFTVGDSGLALGDVPLFAYTTTPPSQPVLFTPGAVTTAGQAKFTACNIGSASTTFSGSIHLVAFRG
jgi:hypothetical protein